MQKNKKILIAGGSGALAQSIVKNLVNDSFILIARNKEKLKSLYSNSANTEYYDYNDLFENNINLDNVDLFIHCAFERSENTENLVKSLELSSKIFEKIQQSSIMSIINISSMSAYSFKTKDPGIEKNPANPTNFYGLAKVASEILLEAICKSKNITNVRLAALSGSIYPNHILTKFVKKALLDKSLEVNGGSQEFCFMDSRDAINALSILINSDSSKWEKIYNISDNTQYNIIYMCNVIIKTLKETLGLDIKLKHNKTNDFYFSFELDANLFMESFNWKPKYMLKDTIIEIIEQERKNEQNNREN